MKPPFIFITLLFLLVAGSCTIEKRLYIKGISVSWNPKFSSKNTAKSEPKSKTDQSILTNELTAVEPENHLNVPSEVRIELVDTMKPGPNKFHFALLATKKSTASKHITPKQLKQKTQAVKAKNQSVFGRNGVSTALKLLLFAVVLVLIGLYLIFLASPEVALAPFVPFAGLLILAIAFVVFVIAFMYITFHGI